MSKAQKFVPLAELRRLTTGSFEELADSVRAAVWEGVPHFLGETELEIVSTYPDAAVIFASDLFHHVKLAQSPDGRRYVESVSPLRVEVYDSDQRDAYLMKEAQNVVSLFAEGASDGASALMRQLASLVDGTPRSTDAVKIRVVETVLSLDRPWRKVYESKLENFEAFSGSYEELFEGIDKAFFDPDGCVTEELKHVLARFEEHCGVVEEAIAKLKVDSASKSLNSAVDFAVDLLSDLRAVNEHATRSAASLVLVESRRKLRDLLVESLPRFHRAVGFVKKVSERLAEV